MATFSEVYKRMETRLAEQSSPKNSVPYSRPRYIGRGIEARTGQSIRVPIDVEYPSKTGLVYVACRAVKPDWAFSPDPLLGSGAATRCGVPEKEGIILEQRIFSVEALGSDRVQPIHMSYRLTAEEAAGLDAVGAAGVTACLTMLPAKDALFSPSAEAEAVLASLADFTETRGEEAVQPFAFFAGRVATVEQLETHVNWLGEFGS